MFLFWSLIQRTNHFNKLITKLWYEGWVCNLILNLYQSLLSKTDYNSMSGLWVGFFDENILKMDLLRVKWRPISKNQKGCIERPCSVIFKKVRIFFVALTQVSKQFSKVTPFSLKYLFFNFYKIFKQKITIYVVNKGYFAQLFWDLGISYKKDFYIYGLDIPLPLKLSFFFLIMSLLGSNFRSFDFNFIQARRQFI